MKEQTKGCLVTAGVAVVLAILLSAPWWLANMHAIHSEVWSRDGERSSQMFYRDLAESQSMARIGSLGGQVNQDIVRNAMRGKGWYLICDVCKERL